MRAQKVEGATKVEGAEKVEGALFVFFKLFLIFRQNRKNMSCNRSQPVSLASKCQKVFLDMNKQQCCIPLVIKQCPIELWTPLTRSLTSCDKLKIFRKCPTMTQTLHLVLSKFLGSLHFFLRELKNSREHKKLKEPKKLTERKKLKEPKAVERAEKCN